MLGGIEKTSSTKKNPRLQGVDFYKLSLMSAGSSFGARLRF